MAVQKNPLKMLFYNDQIKFYQKLFVTGSSWGNLVSKMTPPLLLVRSNIYSTVTYCLLKLRFRQAIQHDGNM